MSKEEQKAKLLEQIGEKYKDQDVNVYLEGLLWSKPMVYWDYIQTDALLGLQVQRTTLPDEMIFIMYHQVNELLFKMILWELDQVSRDENISTEKFTKHLSRVSRYFDMLQSSFTVMGDGMDPEQYLKFRNTLAPASGFQSAQYRLIEFASTELINLIDFRFRGSIDRNTPYSHAYEHLYWQAAGKDHKTGKKSPLVQNFEDKYMDFFLGKMEEYNTINLYTKYKSLPEKDRNNIDLKNAMRHYDHTVNVKWVIAHYKAAGKYLEGGDKKVEATGGSEWRKYMHPQYQRRIFFPSLWGEEELKNWGVDNLEGYKKL